MEQQQTFWEKDEHVTQLRLQVLPRPAINMCVCVCVCVCVYGSSETWALEAQEQERTEIAKMRFLRSILLQGQIQ
jgi:hypothetical protein